MRRSEGYVYVLERGPGGPLKIGYSENPTRRVTSLQTGTPEVLRVIATVPGDVALERALHRRFAALHLNGEWFRRDREIFAAFANLVAKQGEDLPASPPPAPKVEHVREPISPEIERQFRAMRVMLSALRSGESPEEAHRQRDAILAGEA